jgi:hypothetical protein
MTAEPAFDVNAAHRYFAADCFNKAWDLIDKQDRTPEEDRLMISLNQASIYHWTKREDCDDQQMSVGYWQASRIHALLSLAAEAGRYAEVCLHYSRELPPFYHAYAYEALARAAMLAGDRDEAQEYAAKAMALTDQVEDKAERELLLNDLAQITGMT